MGDVQARVVSEARTIDYTPAAAVTAGDVVVQAGLVGVASQDIAAAAKGALVMEGVFEVVRAASQAAVAVGTNMRWDEDGTPETAVGDAGTGSLSTSLGYNFGRAVERPGAAASANAADGTSGDHDTIFVLKYPVNSDGSDYGS